jgi:hypothetical protein
MAPITQEGRAKRELRLRLYQINLDRGFSPAEAAARATQALEKIVRIMSRGVDHKRNDILGNELYSQMVDAHIRALKPPEDWIRHLAEWEGRSVSPGVRRRSLQLLSGERAKPRKSKVELQARELADKIRRWLRLPRRRGPNGPTKIRQRGHLPVDDGVPIFDPSSVRLSIRDSVKIAAEAIGNHAGAEIDFSNPTARAALKAAVLILRPNAERSVGREIGSYLAVSDKLLKSH